MRRRWWGTPSPVNACSGGGGGDDDDAGVKIRRPPPPPPPPPYVYVSDVTTGGLLAPLPRRRATPQNAVDAAAGPLRRSRARILLRATVRHNIVSYCRTYLVLLYIRRAPASFTCVYSVRARAPAFPLRDSFFFFFSSTGDISSVRLQLQYKISRRFARAQFLSTHYDALLLRHV